MLQKYTALEFKLFIESLESFDPCVSLGKLIKRCKDAIEQKTPGEGQKWVEKNISHSGFRVIVGPYQFESDDYRFVFDLYMYIKQYLRNEITQSTQQTIEQKTAITLDQIPNLDSKLKKRIIVARSRGILQDKHVEYYVATALQPTIRTPGGLVQSIFWKHIAERFRNHEARIVIETQIDPYL